jgi:hypothetical protein
MEGNLGTTNVFLGIIAVVSILEALVVAGIGIGAYLAYKRVMELVNGLEARQVGPTMLRVNAILDDLKQVSARVRDETERVDQAIRSTMDRVDESADRLRSNVRARTSRLVGLVRGARVAIETMLSNSRAA